ncbi:hypothetical protein ACFXTH_031760 [Malus domestica]
MSLKHVDQVKSLKQMIFMNMGPMGKPVDQVESEANDSHGYGSYGQRSYWLEATRALHHEMPVELLRASLPHTDEHQRKLLSDFAHRSMPISGLNAHGGSGGRMNSGSVRG